MKLDAFLESGGMIACDSGVITEADFKRIADKIEEAIRK